MSTNSRIGESRNLTGLYIYYDATHGDLKLAGQIDGRWRTQVVDGDGSAGVRRPVRFPDVNE